MIKTIINYKFCKNLDSFPISNDGVKNEFFFKSCLIYKFLYKKYFKKQISLIGIMYKLNYGIFELFFRSNSNVLKNHLIFHYAFTKFYNNYKMGRGSLYLFDSRINHLLSDLLQELYIGFFIREWLVKLKK